MIGDPSETRFHFITRPQERTQMAQHANRRRFLQSAVGSSVGAWVGTGVPGPAEASKDAGSSALPDAGGVAKKFWIDPSIAAWRPVPWRKVHIEYHTSRHMPKLAHRFDADEFGDRLVAAHVNGARPSSPRICTAIPTFRASMGGCIQTFPSTF